MLTELLTVLTAIREDLDSSPSTHILVYNPSLTPVSEDKMPSSGLCRAQACMWYNTTSIQANNRTHKKKQIKKINRRKRKQVFYKVSSIS